MKLARSLVSVLSSLTARSPFEVLSGLSARSLVSVLSSLTARSSCQVLSTSGGSLLFEGSLDEYGSLLFEGSLDSDGSLYWTGPLGSLGSLSLICFSRHSWLALIPFGALDFFQARSALPVLSNRSAPPLSPNPHEKGVFDMKQDKWTPNEITGMLTNPFYTGIQAHPDLAVARPVYREKFFATARTYIETQGAETFLREFLWLLKYPDEWALRVIRVHPRFTKEHDAILTEDRFVQAGAIQIRDLGIELYCEYLLRNLEAGE